MVVCDLSVCCVTLVVIYALSDIEVVIWVGSGLYGFAVATVYPSAMAYMSERVSVGGKLLSYLVMAACAGDALVPMAEGFALSSDFGPTGMILVAMVSVLQPFLILFYFICLTTQAAAA